MSSRNMVASSLGAVLILFGSASVKASFLYQQEFVNSTTGNIPVNSSGIGWKAFVGATATDKSGTVDLAPAARIGVSNLNGAPIGSSPSPGYLFTAAGSGTVPTPGIIATFVELASSIVPTSMEWKMANTGAEGITLRVLVRDATNGQWYASALDHSTSADEGTATTLQAGNHLQTHTFSVAASDWLNVTLNPGTALSVGSPPSSSLSGQYDRIGFLSIHPTGNTTVRIDQLKVIPEPASLGLAILAGIMLLPRRRGVMGS